MALPKFLIGDNIDYPNSIFVIHTEYPRFVIDLVDDTVDWLEDLSDINEDELALEMANLIEEAGEFYDNQIKSYENE